MSMTIMREAGDKLDRLAREIQQSEGIKDYSRALNLAIQRNARLAHEYQYGTVGVRRYELSPLEARMAELQADPALTRRLAGEVLTHHANQLAVKLDPTHQLRPETLSQAMKQLSQEYPSLAAASENGFISSTDYFLLGILIPSVAGEIEKEKGVKPVMSYRDERTSVRRYSSEKSHVQFDAGGNEFRTYSIDAK